MFVMRTRQPTKKPLQKLRVRFGPWGRFGPPVNFTDRSKAVVLLLFVLSLDLMSVLILSFLCMCRLCWVQLGRVSGHLLENSCSLS